MSFTDDPRPDTRRYVVWERILNFTPAGGLLIILAISTLVPDEAHNTGLWSAAISSIYFVALASITGWFVVRRAKKNADARWALAQSRSAALAAKLAAVDPTDASR